ncbi:MAG: DegT/DnrJ/EryC1/StrS family aminotransferase [Elusimicrobiota bacterium]|jgi:dTDP-4-amino-4,6-dideoxygalactose transaminase|nr:DegT/DnrJ/EryC1/StrS family aminotransferase [Elusimicrobiota bacterium]
MINIASPILGKKEKDILLEVIDSNIIASGKYVEDFEKKFIAYCGAKFAVANANGTAALHTALLASGIAPADKVATTPFTFIATANSILYAGAKPVFVDINPDTFNIDVQALEETLKREKNIKAVIVVHLYGLMCDMDAILALQKKYKFKLIEDCAQAHGAEFKGKKAGTFGQAAAFSFYATKNMTTGEGGMTLLENEKADKLARQIINHGRSAHSTFTIVGFNYRLTNLQAALGIVQLERLEEWTKKRIENAKKYDEAFSGFAKVITPKTCENFRHVYHLYTLKIEPKFRTKMLEHLKKNEIGCGIYYDTVLYKQPVYKKMGYVGGQCPVAEKIVKEVFSIPVGPKLTQEDTDKIIKTIKNF